MFTAVNLFLVFLYVFYSRKIFKSSFDNKRIVRWSKSSNEYHQINRVMTYLIFVVCTAPFFLGQFSLLKYGTYFITLLILIGKGVILRKSNIIITCYIFFLLWLLFTATWSPSIYDAAMLMIKYTIPLLSLYLGYSAIQEEADLYFFAKYVTKTSIVYALLIGGLSAIFTPSLYFFLNNVFITYAGLADYFTSIVGLFFVLSWITYQKKYYLGAGWLLLSTILEVVRTGLGGITIVGSMFSLMRYKLKAIPYIILFGGIFLGIVLYVPEVNQKFFGDGGNSVTLSGIIKGEAMNGDKIQTSGRDEMWNILLDKFYEPSPTVGSGLGAATHYMKDKVTGFTESDIVLIHSDYVQLLCDAGIVSVILWGLFFVILLIKVGVVALSSGYLYSKISAALAVSSMAGVVFSMGYDNVVSHSMTSLINPFIFVGFFLKYNELRK